MMMVYFMVMTLCTGTEGCLDERRPKAFATQAECMEAIGGFDPRRGVKYRCQKGPQTLISQDIRQKRPAHLAGTAMLPGEATAITTAP